MKMIKRIKNFFRICKVKPTSCSENKNDIGKQDETQFITDILPVEEKENKTVVGEVITQETKPVKNPRKPRPNTAQGEKGHVTSVSKKEDSKGEKTPAKKKRKYHRKNTQNKKKKSETPQ